MFGEPPPDALIENIQRLGCVDTNVESEMEGHAPGFKDRFPPPHFLMVGKHIFQKSHYIKCLKEMKNFAVPCALQERPYSPWFTSFAILDDNGPRNEHISIRFVTTDSFLLKILHRMVAL